jgi:hypothetical protein
MARSASLRVLLFTTNNNDSAFQHTIGHEVATATFLDQATACPGAKPHPVAQSEYSHNGLM